MRNYQTSARQNDTMTLRVKNQGDFSAHSLPCGRNLQIPQPGTPMEIEPENGLEIARGISQSNFLSPHVDRSKRLQVINNANTNNTVGNYFNSAEKRKEEPNKDNIYFEEAFGKLKTFSLQGFLDNHEITEKFRGKMLDWMVEVLKIYKQSEQTLFRSFYLLDLYFSRCQVPVSSDDLHLLGAVAMLIASKHEEISPIRLSSLLQTICRDKFTKEQIIAKELDFLTVIGFHVNFPTIYELNRCAFRLLEIPGNTTRAFFENSALLISKMCLFSGQILKTFSLNEITAFSIILSLKLVDNATQNFNSDEQIQKMIKKFELDDQVFLEKLHCIHNFTMQFDSIMPYIKNLKKYYGFNSA